MAEKTRHVYILLLVTVSMLCIDITECSLMRFAPRTEYKYVYKGHTNLLKVGTIRVVARVSILPLEITDAVHLCRLKVTQYDLMVSDGTSEHIPNLPEALTDFSKWLSFNIDTHGTVTDVYHVHDEDPHVLALKKILLGTLSSKLVISEESVKDGKRWAYRVTETGHEGEHEATYQAEPSPNGEGITFNKTRHTKALENANQGHTKVIRFHPGMQIPRSVSVKEHFKSPTEASADYKPSKHGNAVAEPEDPNYKVPQMSGFGEGEMTLERASILNDEDYLRNIVRPKNLTRSTIEVGQIPLPELSLEQVKDDFQGNFTCIKVAQRKDQKIGYPCFRSLLTLSLRLNDDDLETLTMTYLKEEDISGKQTIVDLLGSLATNKSWSILVEHVIFAANPHPDLVSRAITSFVEEGKKYPKVVLDALERLVFERQYDFNDTQMNAQVNDMVVMVLGAVVDYMKPYDPVWSQDTASRLEERLGVHDPWHHRHVRSVMDTQTLDLHLNVKSTHLLALGNAKMDSSYDCIKSYLNSSDTHILLKTSALDAIAEYHKEEVASILLATAMDRTEDDNVRDSALNKYENHPYGGDVRTVIAMMQGERNVTALSRVEHERVRRGLKDTVARIWKGFQFHLQTPSIDYQKWVGGTALGASFGLIVKNLIDIDIAPLKGHLIVDVHDKGWATLHLGILGINWDLFKAELCFKGSIRYDINILKEFGFEDVKHFAEIYNKHIPKVVKLVKDSVTNFRELTASFKNYSPSEIIEDLIDSLVELPKNITNLRRIGKRLFNAVAKFTDLPPVVQKVLDLVNHVTTLFNDIKTDVMRLYNSIVDMVTVHIPWAWEEIRTAIRDIGKHFKNIIKNPKSTIQGIGRAVGRIATAVGVLLQGKDEILASNFFAKENRPYWFDITSELSAIWDKVGEVAEAIEDAWTSLKSGEEANRVAKEFTGVDLDTMKRQALQEIVTIALEEFEEPLNHLRRLIDPFVKAVEFFTGTLKNIKEAWTTLIQAYREARSLLEMVFGSKAHKDFPRKYLESESCGDGFWPTTGGGRYSHRGVMAEIGSGTTIVSPFNGNVTSVEGNHVIINVEHIKDVEIIISNIAGRDDIEGVLIGAGEDLGTVLSPSGCSDGHVHISLRKISSKEYVDPSRYMERREIPKPQWIQECDRYLLVWKGKKLYGGSILGGPDESDETPAIPDAPPAGDLVLGDLGTKNRRRKRSFFDKIGNFTKSLGLPDKMNKLKEIFSFRMDNITLKTVFDFMDRLGLTDTKEKIMEILEKIESLPNMEMCVRPDSLDTNELRQRLILAGKSDSGARKTLINRYLEKESKCFGLRNVLTDNVYCRFDDSCTGLYCCLDLELFIYRHAVTAFVRFDPCSYEVTFGFNEWSHTVSVLDKVLPLEGNFEVRLEVFKIARMLIDYDIRKEGSSLKVSVELQLCSNRDGVCIVKKTFLKDAEIPLTTCKDDESQAAALEVTRPANSPTVNSMMDMKISDIIKLVDTSGLSEEKINEIVQELREAFQTWLQDQIKQAIAKIFGDEFSLFDMCAKGYEIEFGPYKKTFFEGQVNFMLGPIPMYFGWGVGGSYGAKFQATLCIMSMKATARVVPQVGSHVWGSLGVRLGPLKAELRLTGYLLTTVFPAKAVIEFHKFPLEVRARMDLELVPLRIELHALLIFEIKIRLPWGKKIHIKKTLIKVKLWNYQSRSIKGTIFNYNDAEPDNTPPDFTQFSRATEVGEVEGEGEEEKGGSRRRRAIATTTKCTVYQLAGRDYTEPAFQIELGVDDDRSEVEMTYKVGTHRGGNDVVNTESLGGSSALVSKWLTSGRPLYYTVTATNSMGLSAHATCGLNTYDMTPPSGRVGPEYLSTSNPTVLHGSVFVLDDSPIIDNKIGVGLGKGWEGDQTIPWHEISDLERSEKAPNIGADPLGLRSLEHFSTGKLGALVKRPFRTTTYTAPVRCAKDCLSFPALQCQSFNYDYGNAGTCELMEAVQSHDIKVHKRGMFHYFERKGIGHVSSLHYDGLDLQHNQMYYINNYLENTLGYKNILTGKGTLFDKSPPNPGPLANIMEDDFGHEPCVEFTPVHFQSRCAGETPLPNYRYIIDGPGSATVFNGPKQLIDLKYTRINTMMAANWDGIHENETHILIYVWGVGTDHCEDDIHPHRDPHAHLASSNDWTHTGIVHPVLMPDGIYHVTVRAINDVEYGGPMAVAVCHSTPYVIDTTAPIIYDIFNITYNESSFEIGVILNATDDVSGIKRVEFGLGTNPRNTYILDYMDVTNFTHPTFSFKVPDGVPTWIKIRVTNHVDLRAVDHADKPIVVDTSPPIAGVVLDGERRGTDLFYQNSTSRYCAHWEDFHDPESGISRYIVALGTSPNSTDIVDWEELSPRVHSWCANSLSLQHKSTYYFTVMAINGGLKERNVTATSDGVYVDATAPVAGWVKDGEDEAEDMMYSSDSATVSATTGGFSDPESDIIRLQADIYRTHNIPGSKEQLIHREKQLAKDTTSYTRHHFHHHHGDSVRTEITGYNGAESSVSVTSDGFTVDLTDPILSGLVDGKDINIDPRFTSSMTTLSATWSYNDPESGIAYYLLSVYELYQGKRNQIFPANGELTLDGSVTTWEESGLTLRKGTLYSVRVTAVNGAGLAAVHDTTGVIVDPTPPKMLYVHAGVLGGSTEEVIDGYVIHNDQTSISASWKGRDPESGVQDYMLAIGTAPGAADVLGFAAMGTKEDGIITGLNLELYEINQKVYYISVKAVNGAGQESDQILSSSPIKMVSGDITGSVMDGSAPDVDIDYQLDTGTLTITYSGFQSEAHGISRVEAAVGTRPGRDDVIPFNSLGIISEEDPDVAHIGMGGSGKLQMLAQLTSGRQYYVTVRAHTGTGNILESSSDGVFADTSPPEVTITSAQGYELPLSQSAAGPVFVRMVDPYSATWSVRDGESSVSQTVASLGSYPAGADQIKDVSNFTSLPVGLLSSGADEGLPTIFRLRATNILGLETIVDAPEFVADTSVPLDGVVSCPKYVNPKDFTYGIKCTWTGFADPESGNGRYMVAMGLSEGDDSIKPYTELSAEANHHIFLWHEDSPVEQNTNREIIVTVIGENRVGGQRVAYSPPIWVDHSPPTPGRVIELTDTLVYNISFPDYKPSCAEGNVCDELDTVCQKSLTQISVAWEQFTDEESDVHMYQVALGSTPGGTQIHDFTPAPPGQLYTTLRGLDLSRVRRVFATVKGYNGAGLYAASTSDGVWISRVSGGLSPLSPQLVWDGQQHGVDLQYQEDNTGLSATWDFSGDPCPIVKYELEFRRFDGEVVLPMQEIPQGQTSGMVDGLKFKDGESYYAVVRATNAIGHRRTLHSDGVTVKLEPILPGNVRDGDIQGVDLNFWPHTDRLAGNWDGFGIDRAEYLDVMANADPNVDVEIGEHQTVAFYEVAAGTDRRYPNTRTNIHPFINVGLNKTWTFEHLTLEALTATYYFTVRAHSLSTTTTEVTSNGIKVGYGALVISHGELELPRYISSKTEFEFSWSEFEFVVPIQSYHWMMGRWNNDITNLNCTNLETYIREGTLPPDISALFDVVPPTSVGTDTVVQSGNISLTQGETYGVLVLAIDESGGCAHVYDRVTVDVTPPTEGALQLGDGRHRDMAIWYSPSSDQMDLTWTGYEDMESHIKYQSLGIYKAPSCSSDPSTHVLQGELISLEAGTTNYTFINMELDVLSTYHVHLEVGNNAGLITKTISPPILVDSVSPSAGAVKDGTDFVTDRIFQSDTTYVQGVALYLPSPAREACPQREPLASPGKVSRLDSQDIREFTDPEAVMTIPIQSNQAQVSNNEATLGLIRDVKFPRMIGSAITLDADILNGGTYEFKMMTAAAEFHPVTSVAFLPKSEETVFKDFLGNVFNETGPGGPEHKTKDFGKVVDSGTTASTVHFEYVDAPNKGFGFQIHSGVNDEEDSSLILWCLRSNQTWYEKVDLDFDPSAAENTYTLIVNEGGLEKGDLWHLSMYINNKQYVSVYGVTPLYKEEEEDEDYLMAQTAKEEQGNNVQIGLYPRRSHLMPLDDIFKPPKTATTISSMRFPPASTDLCRYGQPFKAGDQSIVEFVAAVGTQPGLDDVKAYQTAHKPCIPCIKSCDRDVCDPDCKADQIQTIPVRVDGLSLVSAAVSSDGNGNNTVLEPYYLTIIGRTASGREISSTSNGIYVDPTPPNITDMYHLDLSWDSQEPIEYQGNNDSIAIYWEAEDLESEIVEFMWAIGSTKGGTEIQSFVSVGLSSFAQNTSLLGLLEDETTYYVTVRARNGAGLWSSAVSGGVTILLRSPDMSNVSSEIDDSSPFPENTRGEAVKTERQDHVGVGWGEPPAEEHVEGIYVEMGTGRDQSDLFPQTQVGYNNSGKLDLSGGGAKVEGAENPWNLSDVRGPRSKRDTGQLLMEPGRSIVTHVKACSKAHKCSLIPVKDIMIVRNGDITATARNGVLNGDLNDIKIQSLKLLHDGMTLVFGALSGNDMRLPYKCESSASYKPYISDPEATVNKTNRIMKNRIQGWGQEFFYLSTLPGEPIPGGLQITVTFDTTLYPDGEKSKTVPRLLTWCQEEEFWVDVSRSCRPLSAHNSQIDWDTGKLTVKVCDIEDACLEGRPPSSRKRRATDPGSTPYSGPSAVGLADTSVTVANTPPRVTSPGVFTMQEDAGKAVIRLEAEDADGDGFIYKLDTEHTYPGIVTLSSTGLMEFTPVQNFAGTAKIYFKVIEIQYIEGIEPLITESVLNIVVQPVNDHPELLLISEGRDIIPSNNNVDLTVEQNTNRSLTTHEIPILLVGYDVDDGDEITVIVAAGSDGDVVLTQQVREVTTVAQDCSLPWGERSGMWGTLEADLRRGSTPVSLPMPCGLTVQAPASSVQWVTVLVTYTPHIDFHGVDTIQILVEDKESARSEILNIRAHVQEFPCENEAQCQGPESDPRCEDKERAYGFIEEGYRCSCLPDYTGVYCQYQIDDCDPDPCPANYTCTDDVLSYNCTCDDLSWPCAESPSALTTLQLVLSTTFPVIAVGIVVTILLVVCLRKKCSLDKDKRTKVPDSRNGNPFDWYPADASVETNSAYSTRGLFKPDIQRQKTKHGEWYDNPLFGDDLKTSLPPLRAKIGYNPYNMPASSGKTLTHADIRKSFQQMRERRGNYYSPEPELFFEDEEFRHPYPSLPRTPFASPPTQSEMDLLDADSLPDLDAIEGRGRSERFDRHASPLIPRPSAPTFGPVVLPPLGVSNRGFSPDDGRFDRPEAPRAPWERPVLGHGTPEGVEEIPLGRETRTLTPTGRRPRAWKDTFRNRIHGLTLFPRPHTRGRQAGHEEFR